MKANRESRLTQRSDFDGFDAQLAALKADVSQPNHGFFGPDSMTWQVSREPALLSMGMRPLLMQIANPKVAQGVADHSNYRTEPLSRGFRTFDAVYKLVFGSVATAEKTASMVFRIHDRVRGSLDEVVPGTTPDYVANDPYLALWVHSTLIDSAVLAYETYFRPLSTPERNRYYEESKIFAQLFGVPKDVIPPTWTAFQKYVRHEMETLHVTEVAKDVGRSLIFGAPKKLKVPFTLYNAIGAKFLDERIRVAFGLPYGWVEQQMASAGTAAIGVAMRTLPRDVRALPAARAAERRLGIANGITAKGVQMFDRMAVEMARESAQTLQSSQA